MALPLTPRQVRTRERLEGVIRLMAPVLDLMLAVGDRVSRIVEPDDVEHPPRVPREAPPFATREAPPFALRRASWPPARSWDGEG